MKKLAILLAMIMAIPFAFADINLYGDYSNAVGDAAVGEKGYVDARYYSAYADVFVCGLKDGTIVNYGMNLQNDNQFARGLNLLRELAQKSFAVFDHYGCLRARV